MKSIELLIWDWNGTLLDDAWLCVDILNKMLAARNKPVISLEDYRRDFGFPVRDFYALVGFDFDRETFEKPATEWFEAYNRRRYECKLREGVAHALASFRQKGLIQVILSAYPAKHLTEVLAHYQLLPYFSELSGGDDHYAAGKIENGRRLLQKLGATPAKTLMVGDTLHDHEAAESMGIECVLLEGGHQTRGRLQASGCPVFADLDTLSKFLS